jgi:hypothetical protein
MKSTLIILIPLFLIVGAVCISGCLENNAKPEMKFVDKSEPKNFIVFNQTVNSKGEKAFVISTTQYLASGTYVETSEFFSLKYNEYPVGTTIRKVYEEEGAAIEVSPGHYWYKA